MLNYHRSNRVALAFCIGLILLGSFGMMSGSAALDMHGQTTYAEGEDWVIDQHTYAGNGSLLAAAEVTIENGASLTLNNASFAAESIVVEDGAELHVIQGSTFTGLITYANGSAGAITQSTLLAASVLIGSSDVAIEGAVFEDCVDAVIIHASAPVIENCTFRGETSSAISGLEADNLSIKNITIESAVAIGLLFQDCEDVYLADNDISWAGQAGISLNNCTGTVARTSVELCGDGVYVGNSVMDFHETVIRDCNASACGSEGCGFINTGTGLIVEWSIVNWYGGGLLNNTYGAYCFNSTLTLQGANVSDNHLEGITGEVSKIHSYNSTFMDNWGMAIHLLYRGIGVMENNTFSGNYANILQEWLVLVEVKDAYNYSISNAKVLIEDAGGFTQNSTTTLYGSVQMSVVDYMVDADGMRRDHNPQTITASKQGFDIDSSHTYANTTEFAINDNTYLLMDIGLKKPDLVAEGIRFTTIPGVGEETTIVASIVNGGDTFAGDVNVTFFVSDENGYMTKLASETIDIGVGETRQVSVPWTPASDENYTITVIVDFEAYIEELDEDNNEANRLVLVREGGISLPIDWEYLALSAAAALVILLGYILYNRSRLNAADLPPGEPASVTAGPEPSDKVDLEETPDSADGAKPSEPGEEAVEPVGSEK